MYHYLKLLTKRRKKVFFNEFDVEYDVKAMSENSVALFRSLFDIPKYSDLPISYSFIAGFKPMMKALTHKHFAFSPLGLIHLTAEFKALFELDYRQPFTVKIKVKQNRRHPLGKLIQIESQFFQNGHCCVINKNSMLKKLVTMPKQNKLAPQSFAEPTNIELNNKVARLYAKASYDFNPIHISDRLAKLFGMPQAIMHGMYLGHLVLIKNDIKSKRVKLEFKRPCLLPSAVGFANKDEQYQVFSGSEDLHLNCKVFATED